MQAGYAVIFVYRKGSIQPFTKGLPSAQLLDILTDVLVDNDKAGAGVHVQDEASAILQTAVRKARECNEQGTLLRIPYITLFEYLQVIATSYAGRCHAYNIILQLLESKKERKECMHLFAVKKYGGLLQLFERKEHMHLVAVG